MKWLLLCLLLFACIPFYSQNFYGGVLIGFTASQVDGTPMLATIELGFAEAFLYAGKFPLFSI